MNYCLGVIKGIPSLSFVILILASSICKTVVSSITTVSGLDSFFTSSPDGIGSSVTIQKEPANSTSAFKITDEIKNRVNALLDSNRTNAAIVIGIVGPSGTQFYGNGKLSNRSNATVDQNTIFAIGSNTKVFTTILLAQMVEDGLIKLNDPIDKKELYPFCALNFFSFERYLYLRPGFNGLLVSASGLCNRFPFQD